MSNNSPVPRRTFLTCCSAAGALGVASTLTEPWSDSAFGDKGLSLEDFDRQIGTAFFIDSKEGRVRLELEEVTLSKFPPGKVGRQRPFSIVYRVAGGHKLPQDVYAVRHPRLGQTPQLLVPVFSKDEQRLEAVFG